MNRNVTVKKNGINKKKKLFSWAGVEVHILWIYKLYIYWDIINSYQRIINKINFTGYLQITFLLFAESNKKKKNQIN